MWKVTLRLITILWMWSAMVVIYTVRFFGRMADMPICGLV